MSSESNIVKTQAPPYYAVIFTSVRSSINGDYEATARRMLELAAQQPGFLGVDTVREGAVGITVSYWTDEESIAAWKRNVEHLEAQMRGRKHWYQEYRVRVARIEREYGSEFRLPPAGGSQKTP